MQTFGARLMILSATTLALFACSKDHNAPLNAPPVPPKTLTSQQWEQLTNNPKIKEWFTLQSTDAFLESFSMKVQNGLNVESARAWANHFLKSHTTAANFDAIEIPKTIKDLEPNAAAFGSIERDAADGSSVLFIEWGGGFRHWGLAFSESENLLKRRRAQFRSISAGVYTFISVDSPKSP